MGDFENSKYKVIVSKVVGETWGKINVSLQGVNL